MDGGSTRRISLTFGLLGQDVLGMTSREMVRLTARHNEAGSSVVMNDGVVGAPISLTTDDLQERIVGGDYYKIKLTAPKGDS